MKLLYTLESNSGYTIAENLTELQTAIVKVAGIAVYNDVVFRVLQLDNEAYETILDFKADIKQLRKEAKNNDLHQLVLHSIQSQIEKMNKLIKECIITELEREVA